MGLEKEKVCPSVRAGGFLLLQEPPLPSGCPWRIPSTDQFHNPGTAPGMQLPAPAPAKLGLGRSCLELLQQIAQEINSHLSGIRKAINCPSRHQIDGSSQPRAKGGRWGKGLHGRTSSAKSQAPGHLQLCPTLGDSNAGHTSTGDAHPRRMHIHRGRAPAA